MGRQPSALNAARGGVVACAASALLHVPLDVWLLILRHLPAASYAALSQVCRRLLHLVDQHAWRLLLLSLHSTISLSALAPFHREYVEHAKRTRSSRLAARSLEWFACRHAAQLRTSWNELVLEAQSIDLPAALGAKIPPAGRPRWQRGDFAIPTLAIGDTWTAVGVRRDLFVAPAPSPTSPPALEARFVLDSQAQPGTMLTPAQGRVAVTTDPWHDITAIRPVDAAASRLVVGYADGSVQMLAVHSSSSVEVQRTFESMTRFEVAGVSVFSPEDGEEVWMASVSKRGQLRIHLGAESMAWQIDEDGTASPTTDAPDSQSSRSSTPRSFRSAALNNARAEGGGGTRAWSVLLRERWVAVGMTGEQAVYVYPLLRSAGLELGEPMYVGTRLRSSVFALATAPGHSHIPPWLLFAGFYDGTVRVYDTRSLNEPGRRRREMDAIAVLKEDRPTDAVYSLAFGGPRAHLLIAGGARHAQVRVFDIEFLEHYTVPLLASPGATKPNTGWTAFALPSTDSPQYALAATPSHLLGVTDRKFWCFNFASPLLTHPRSPPIAYFSHADPELLYSSCTL